MSTTNPTAGSVIINREGHEPSYSLERKLLDLQTSISNVGQFVYTQSDLISRLALGGYIQLSPNARIIISSASLILRSNTTLDLNGGTLFLTNGANKSVIKNLAFDATPATITISSSGIVATVTWTAHGKAVGDYVTILGAVQPSYTGVWRVATVADANTLTYNMNEPASASPATGTLTGRTGDVNISLINGFVDYNGANQTVSGNNEMMAVKFFSAANIYVDNVIGLNANKYSLWFTGCANVKVPHYFCNTLSDGLHLTGPINGFYAGIIAGMSNDDLFACTISDFAAYQVSEGPLRDIVVDTLNPINALTAMKFAGSAAGNLEYLRIGNTVGTTQHQAFYFTNDTGLLQSNIDFADLGDISVYAGTAAANTYPTIQIRGGGGGTALYKTLKFGTIRELNNDTISSVLFADATYGSIDIDGYYSRSSGARRYFEFSGAATVQKWVSIAGIDVTPADSASSLFLIAFGTANVPLLRLSGIHVPVAGTNAKCVQLNGTTATLSKIVYDGMTIQGGSGFFEQSAASSNPSILHFTGGSKGDAYATGVSLRGSGKIVMDMMDWGTFTNRPLQIITAGLMEVLGSAYKPASRLINATTATASANGPSLYCDVTVLAGRTGDCVTDTADDKVKMFTAGAWTAIA